MTTVQDINRAIIQSRQTTRPIAVEEETLIIPRT